jgi:hypothetical protein
MAGMAQHLGQGRRVENLFRPRLQLRRLHLPQPRHRPRRQLPKPPAQQLAQDGQRLFPAADARLYSNPKSVMDVGWVSAQRVTQHNQDVGLRPTA